MRAPFFNNLTILTFLVIETSTDKKNHLICLIRQEILRYLKSTSVKKTTIRTPFLGGKAILEMVS